MCVQLNFLCFISRSTCLQKRQQKNNKRRRVEEQRQMDEADDMVMQEQLNEDWHRHQVDVDRGPTLPVLSTLRCVLKWLAVSVLTSM